MTLLITEFDYKGLHVKVHVKRQKHSYMRLKEGVVCISTPIKSVAFYKEFIDARLNWIQSQLQKHIAIDAKTELLLFGKSRQNPAALQKKIDKRPDLAQKYQDAFYRELTALHVEKFYQQYTPKMGLYASKIVYRKMRRRWGSCSALKVLTFNTHLVKLPLELIEYVVVHELSHLKHMNHSRAFHHHVKTYLPNEAQLRSYLLN